MELQLEQGDLHELSAAIETNYEHTNAFLKITVKISNLFWTKVERNSTVTITRIWGQICLFLYENVNAINEDSF